jgi:hypothetical protein
MTEFESLLSGGFMATVVLLVVALEGALLYFRWRRRGAPAPQRWLSQIVAGAFLVLALLVQQLSLHAFAVGACLAAAGLAHLAGYRSRWLQ